ncbi:MAG: hypothetical protein R2844_22285, partial [Caldilineales bacterium]
WPFAAVWLGVGLAALANWLHGASQHGRWVITLLAALLIVVPLGLNWQTNDLSRDRGAEEFVDGVLGAVAEDALVLTAGDRATFGLWYGRYGAGRRPDVLPVSRDLWTLANYRTAVGAAQPGLGGESVGALIENARAVRPVYLAQAGPDMPDLPPPPAGAVWESLPAPPDESGRPRWQLYRLVQN